MALIQCHECRAQVSDHAGTCPKCGAPVIATIKRRQRAFLIALAIQLVFVVIIVAASLLVLRHFMHKVMAPLQSIEQKQN
jgi:hypothetical protein